MKVQILGTGCPKCQTLEKNTRTALEELQINDYTLEKVLNVDEMMEMGMMVSPGLAIDGQLLKSGKVLSVDDVKFLLYSFRED